MESLQFFFLMMLSCTWKLERPWYHCWLGLWVAAAHISG